MHPSDDHVIVTAASQDYAHLLKGLVLSIRDGEQGSRPANRLPIKVLDLGLTDETVDDLSAHCVLEPAPDPPFPVHHDDHPRSLLLSRALRPFLPRFFPGFRVYTWLDADTWVQDVTALSVLRDAALVAGLAVVPAFDRSYACLYDKRSEHYRWMQPVIAQVFGDSVATDLAFRPIINSGVFSATPSSPLWTTFAEGVQAVFSKSRLIRDQPAFNVAVYRHKIPFYPLPSRYNWLCLHRLPRLDQERRVLTAPALPHEDLSILHLTKRRCHRDLPVACSDGLRRPLRLDYLGLHGKQRDITGSPVKVAPDRLPLG